MNKSDSVDGTPIPVFFGASVEAKKMLSFDWSDCEIGTTDKWPFILTSSLRMCYFSPIPTFVLWGKELLLFYNDASHFLFANSYYQAGLNHSATQVWEDIWPHLSGPLEAVYSTGVSKQTEPFSISLLQTQPEIKTKIIFLFHPILNRNYKVQGILGYFIPENNPFNDSLFDYISGNKKLLPTNSLSAEKQKEKDLIIKKDEAEHKNHMKDLLLAALSHELRSPLTSIISWVQILIQGKVSKERKEMGLKAIEASAQAQNLIINDLIDISAVILGKISTNFEKINLVDALKQAINISIPSVEAKKIKLLVNLPFDSIPIFGDSIRMHQIFLNILSNSVKFTPDKGEIKINLTVEEVNDKKTVLIDFIDNGLGIKQEFLQHIFELYNQADISFKKYDGLGIGLSMVVSLLKLHQGDIVAHSEGPNKGATFKVSLPVLTT